MTRHVHLPRRSVALASMALAFTALTGMAAPKKIVVLAGRLDSHPPGTHEYEKSALLVQHCLQTAKNLPEPPRVEVHFGGWPADERTLDDADGIVVISGGSDQRETDHPLFVGNRMDVLGRHMARGCGLALYHWSTFAPLRAKGQLLEWVGGFFDYESGPAPRRWLSAIDTKPDWAVTPATPSHPALRGVSAFTLREEFYHHMRFAENDARRTPLLTVGPDVGAPENVVGWAVERADGGRGFGFTGGHFHANWEVPAFRKAVLNAIAWTAKIDIPEGGIDSTTKPIAETRGAEVWKAEAPLEPALWPQATHPVNRDRLYDFYAKQADWFARVPDVTALLLPEYPGLDGGTQGHWGNQNEDVWRDARWNATDLGSVVSNVWRGANMTIPKGVAVRLGGPGALCAVFNPTTATFDAVWRGGFVKFSDVRHGFMDGASMVGTPLLATRPAKPPVPVIYHGFHRHGDRVIFSYRTGNEELLDMAWEENGAFTRTVAPADSPALTPFTKGGPARWPQILETRGHVAAGGDGTFVIDTLTLPFDNPWKCLFFVTGLDFFANGDAALCTMTGDVWKVSGLDDTLATLRWQRIAAGLHQPLGLRIVDDKVCVLGRDQITRLHDLNGDGEADFHECVTNAYDTSPGGHDFITGLERDAEGAWWFASANQGLCRLLPGAAKPEVIATGFRNPNGVAVAEDGTVITNGQEGEWSNASMLFQAKKGAYFGYGGPRDGAEPTPPLMYLPRGFDNSTGGGVFVGSPAWKAALGANFISLSWGAGTAALVCRDTVDGTPQGLAVALPGEFRSAPHRARFHPRDGHLYVAGGQGWGSYTPDDGCLQRIRLVGQPVLPVAWEACDNGVKLVFSAPLDAKVAASAASHFAQMWTYRYAADYGSPEYSVRHPGEPGHDALAIRSAHLLGDGRTLFLEIPDLRPVKQLHLRVRVGGPRPLDLFATVHALRPAFTAFPGYQPIAKTATPAAPLTISPPTRENPWAKGTPGRAVRLEAALGLQFATKQLTATPGERLSLTFANPDAVPHNFVLVKPGALASVGARINQLIAEPGAAARHYVPAGPDVLVWCDMTNPGTTTAIHFDAPSAPGDYPFLCSFPGHWQVMNGVLVVR